jgi:HPt (histidine-containing phosphotransfer) domain-containing protein
MDDGARIDGTPIDGTPIVVRADPDIADLVPQYLERRRAERGDLHAALQAADTVTLQRLAHRIKGTASGYGCVELGELAAALDAAARDGDLRAAERSVAAMDDWLARAVPAPL